MRMIPLVVWAVFAGAALDVPAWAARPAEPSRQGVLLPAPVVNAILASGLPPSSFGMYAQEVIGEYSMASTTKVVTSLAALDLLGPFYRWRTSAFALGTLADGKLVGDLLIVGGGNAQLTSAELQAWFGRMREQGLREIDGDIVLDRFAFQLSSADHAHTPPQSADQPRHVWPAALTLDEGLLGVAVEPTRGKRAAIALKLALSDVRLDNQVTMGGGCEATARWVAGRDGQATVVVRGSWSAGCGSRTISFVPPAAAHMAGRARAA
jgi:D-alanyl-D-alanine carboxypeptidase/D-alanyl-D-alanine-endopeptidase (penicillin-binding protein 4)